MKDEVAACFATLAAKADLDPIELEELRQLAKTLSGVGLRAINAMLKSAQQQQADARTPKPRAISGPPAGRIRGCGSKRQLLTSRGCRRSRC